MRLRINTRTLRRDLKRRLLAHVKHLSAQIGERNLYQYRNLERAYLYIKNMLESFGISVKVQNYKYDGKLVRNIIAEIEGSRQKDAVLIIGAHYDSVLGSPGADDNASGIAGMLELARLFRNLKPRHTVRFIAFTLEEPPVFGSPEMGSRYYASKLRENNENVIGMICLEMLGYYSSRKGSQQSHQLLIRRQDISAGNFAAIVGNKKSKHIVNQLKHGLEMYGKVPVFSIAANQGVPGTDLSDHSSFWKYDYPAVMLTDTAY